MISQTMHYVFRDLEVRRERKAILGSLKRTLKTNKVI
jgi:hypothetical protein